MQKTAIIVPCYNEADRLNGRAFQDYLETNASVSIVFVNDGSSDNTSDIIRGIAGSVGGRILVIDLPVNRGKAEAVRQGVLAALGGDYALIGYWDADLATPLDAITRFTEVLSNPRLNAVLGSRVRLLGREIERQRGRHYLGRLFATAASIVLGLPVYDTQCGAKLFRRTETFARVFSEPFRTKWAFDVELMARFLALERGDSDSCGFASTTAEYPLDVWHDIRGSKLRWTDFLRAGADLLTVHRVRRDWGQRALSPAPSLMYPHAGPVTQEPKTRRTFGP